MKLFLLFALALPGFSADTWTYWIQPCSGEIARDSGCRTSDSELGIWALEAWQKASGGRLAVKPAASEKSARLRLYWVSGQGQLYGETRSYDLAGQRGAEVFVLPSVAGTTDPLLRDAIVYLTCVHESGHAFGLPHTREFADIMYSFQFGGDIEEYFGRYRRAISARGDIRKQVGLSPADAKALAAALP